MVDESVLLSCVSYSVVSVSWVLRVFVCFAACVVVSPVRIVTVCGVEIVCWLLSTCFVVTLFVFGPGRLCSVVGVNQVFGVKESYLFIVFRLFCSF